MHNQFLELWNEFLNKNKLPDTCTGHFEISNDEFKSLLSKFDRAKSFKIINNLMEGKVLIIISHYAELIKKLNPNTLTIINKDGYASQTDDIEIAYNILENGFEHVGSKV